MMSSSTPIGGEHPLVLLHGWGMNKGVWSTLIPRIGQERRITTIELPGHGAGTYGEECAGLDTWVDHCLHQAPDNADWIGWSLGGQVALRAALMAPRRVRRLVMVCSSPRFVQAADWPHAMPKQTLRLFADSLRKDHQQTLARFLALQVQGDDQAREALRLLRQEVKRHPEPHPDALEAGLELLLQVDLRDQLSSLQIPSLWLLGNKDTLVPGALAQTLRELPIPDASVELIQGCAHAPFLSHPEESVSVINRFLEER